MHGPPALALAVPGLSRSPWTATLDIKPPASLAHPGPANIGTAADTGHMHARLRHSVAQIDHHERYACRLSAKRT